MAEPKNIRVLIKKDVLNVTASKFASHFFTGAAKNSKSQKPGCGNPRRTNPEGWGLPYEKDGGARSLAVKDCGLTQCVHDETPLFLAVKISFRVHSKK